MMRVAPPQQASMGYEITLSVKMNSVKRSMRTTHIVLVAGVLSLGVGGCLTVGQMAPPIDPEFARIAMRSGISRSVLEIGREVYISDCTRCHTVEPISRYAPERWHDIITRMGVESKLDEAHTEALRVYVLTAHKVLIERAEMKSGTN